MKRIKFRTITEPGEENARGSAIIRIECEPRKSANEKPVVTDKDVRKRIAEVAGELWGKMGSLKVVINEISPTDNALTFKLGFPANLRHKVGFLLFFINEINGQGVRIHVEDCPISLKAN